ncbi:MAG: hypothetical protein A3K77_07560 [Euryarchaeota archaeon RBG_13_31_8]|nr:MAG: hypothetical protein A3K77_07560 [Euryarchaeota archaeon RBG_13_31_8]
MIQIYEEDFIELVKQLRPKVIIKSTEYFLGYRASFSFDDYEYKTKCLTCAIRLEKALSSIKEVNVIDGVVE